MQLDSVGPPRVVGVADEPGRVHKDLHPGVVLVVVITDRAPVPVLVRGGAPVSKAQSGGEVGLFIAVIGGGGVVVVGGAGGDEGARRGLLQPA